MLKAKCGFFLPSCEEITTAILDARRDAFIYVGSQETELRVAFECESGRFVIYEVPRESWYESCGKLLVCVPYRIPKDAREIAKEFRATLREIYSAATKTGGVAK